MLSQTKKKIVIRYFQNILLFAIAALLVTGFYYHAEFYKLGWLGLLIIGSIVTFITIKAILYLSFHRKSMNNSDGILIFRPEDVEAIKHKKIKQIIKPERTSKIKPGSIYKAKLNIMSDQYFSELLIKEISSKKLVELSDQDVILTGTDTRSEFKKHWMEKYGYWRPNMIVRLIRFEPISYD